MKVLLTCMIFFCSSVLADATESELHIGRFSSGDLTGWKEQTIGMMKPKTGYSLSKDSDRQILVAHSTKSASGRMYKLNLDPKEYSAIKWSWKIDHTIKKGDEKVKEGDDFAVRIYVLFPRGFFSQTRAVCYVWANKLPKGSHIISPFSKNIITVAEDSGEELAGRWTFHQRNIYEDYKNLFGEEPPKIGAIAIMTDTDNTGESAVGYYGDITLLRSPKPDEPRQKEKKARELPQKEPKHKETPGVTGTPAIPQTAPQPSIKPEESRQKELKNKELPESEPGQKNLNLNPDKQHN